MLKERLIYGCWLKERCPECGGNVYIAYDDITGQYFRKCLQGSHERDLEGNEFKPVVRFSKLGRVY